MTTEDGTSKVLGGSTTMSKVRMGKLSCKRYVISLFLYLTEYDNGTNYTSNQKIVKTLFIVRVVVSNISRHTR